MTSPIRDLRVAIGAALAGLGVEVTDTLPGDVVNPPAIAVGLAAIGPSATSAVAELVLAVDVTLVGQRGDFTDAQLQLDDLEWSTYGALMRLAEGQVTGATPVPIDVAGQTYPGVVFTVEGSMPC